MFESFLIVFALCMDAFFASLAYGAGKIKIPFTSAVVISLVGTGILTFSMMLAQFAALLIPQDACKWVSFSLLMFIGVSSLFQNSFKYFLRKNKGNKKVTFKYSGIDFVVNIYLDETLADADKSKILNAREAFYLSLALSVDSLLMGFSASLNLTYKIQTILLCFGFGLGAVIAGCFIGRKIASASTINLAWLSGLMLIVLAILRLV